MPKAVYLMSVKPGLRAVWQNGKKYGGINTDSASTNGASLSLSLLPSGEAFYTIKNFILVISNTVIPKHACTSDSPEAQ